MTFTVNDFPDLLRLLEAHPEWRGELRRILLPELPDLTRALEALAEAQRRTEATVERLGARMDQLTKRVDQLTERMERGFAEAAADRNAIREEMARGFAEAAADRKAIREEMARGFLEAAADRKRIWETIERLTERVTHVQQDVGYLKGRSQEEFYRSRATAIFGRYLQAGRDAAEAISQRLRAARQGDQITDDDVETVLAADLLWSGTLSESGDELILVLEGSWTVDAGDVERAIARADILRRLGLKALPVVGGQVWPQSVQALAQRAQVVIAQDGRIDRASWQAALAGG